jgi:hypothetical protein
MVINKNVSTILFFIIATSSFIIVSCGGQDTKKDIGFIENHKKAEQIIYPQEAKFDDFSRFVAGKEGIKTSIYKNLEALPEWKSYKEELTSLWKKTNEKLPVIKEWTKNELGIVNNEGGTLFYPFSGADFLHSNLFFPEYDNIVMIALEPIGNFPDLNKKKETETIDSYLGDLKNSMNAILSLSFFRTIAMADDFQSEMDGTLHVIFHFMSRTDHTVLYQERVAILPNGDLTTDLSLIKDTTYIGNRFYFKENGEEKVRTLTYFAVNIADNPYVSLGGLEAKGLKTRTDLVNYFNKINIKSTYLKSASYLMHSSSFSVIRNLILEESEFLLQDDSGIPLQFFDRAKWDLTFYGTYSEPISLFVERHQEDLKNIYLKKEKNVRPLPFGIGYQFKKGTSNLMLGCKR